MYFSTEDTIKKAGRGKDDEGQLRYEPMQRI